MKCWQFKANAALYCLISAFASFWLHFRENITTIRQILSRIFIKFLKMSENSPVVGKSSFTIYGRAFVLYWWHFWKLQIVSVSSCRQFASDFLQKKTFGHNFPLPWNCESSGMCIWDWVCHKVVSLSIYAYIQKSVLWSKCFW